MRIQWEEAGRHGVLTTTVTTHEDAGRAVQIVQVGRAMIWVTDRTMALAELRDLLRKEFLSENTTPQSIQRPVTTASGNVRTSSVLRSIDLIHSARTVWSRRSFVTIIVKIFTRPLDSKIHLIPKIVNAARVVTVTFCFPGSARFIASWSACSIAKMTPLRLRRG